MNMSFLATIAFALLALAMAFIANMVALVFTASPAHVAGVILAIAAAGVSYLAQHLFTVAAGWLAHYQATSAVGYAGPADPDAWPKYQSGERQGKIAQAVACLMAAASVVAFWIGMS